jgi:phosphopantetheinyl transferase
MRFAQRREDWLAGRLAARKLLRGMGYPFEGLEIGNDTQGAPFVKLIESGERLPGCLSISHREGRALCAYTSEQGVKLGVDLERLEERSEAFCRDYFTEREQAWAEGWDEKKRSAWFTLLWSLKECCMKVAGTGLRVDPLGIEVEVDGFEWPMEGGWKEGSGVSISSGERFGLAWMRRGEDLLCLGWEEGNVRPELVEVH